MSLARYPPQHARAAVAVEFSLEVLLPSSFATDPGYRQLCLQILGAPDILQTERRLLLARCVAVLLVGHGGFGVSVSNGLIEIWPRSNARFVVW